VTEQERRETLEKIRAYEGQYDSDPSVDLEMWSDDELCEYAYCIERFEGQ
jgi:hypothetical protein